MAAVCYENLGELFTFLQSISLLFSFSSSVTFGNIENKAWFVILTGVIFNGFTNQNELLYKILDHWGCIIA